MVTTHEDLVALALCAAAVLAGVAFFLAGVLIDPTRRLHHLHKEH